MQLHKVYHAHTYIKIFDQTYRFNNGLTTICRLYEIGFDLGKCNLVSNCFIIMLIIEPPSKNTSSIVFGQPIFESLPCVC
jgi:hypothetical protein